MPAVQTTYLTNIPAGKPGLIAEMERSDLFSRTVESAGGIGFGLAVKQGANEKGVVAWDGTGSIIGVTVRDRSVVGNSAGTDLYAQYSSARLLRKGPIFVTVGAAVAAGDNVYVTAANVFTNVASGNTQIPNARYETAAASGGLAVIFIK